MLLVLAFIATGVLYYYRLANRIIWSVVHVNGEHRSGQAHLLEFPGDNHVVLIDTGFDDHARSELIPYLDERGIDHIDQLVVTHAHRDHYGGIDALLEHGKRIDRVYFNLPPQSLCDAARRRDQCDYRHLRLTRDAIRSSGAALRELATDDVLYYNEDHDVFLEVVFVDDGESPPEGSAGIDDTSALLRLVYGSTTVLFTADISHTIGSHLVKEHFFLDSDIMATSRPGPERTATNQFLQSIDPGLIIVSESGNAWRGGYGDRIRTYAEGNGVPAYVTGLHGNITVTLAPDGYSIASERSPGQP